MSEPIPFSSLLGLRRYASLRSAARHRPNGNRGLTSA